MEWMCRVDVGGCVEVCGCVYGCVGGSGWEWVWVCGRECVGGSGWECVGVNDVLIA